jgi:hypothetical protein
MPNITGARMYVDVPAPERKTGGVIDSVRVIDVTDPHALLGAEYQTDACNTLNEWLSNCTTIYPPGCAGGPPLVDTKDFDTLDMVMGDPFALYNGVRCPSPGQAVDAHEARARASLELKESRGVEKYLTSLLTGLAGASVYAAADVVAAVAYLEQWLDDEYGGKGFIEMSRHTAVYACNAQIIGPGLDGRMSTCGGTPVILGIGDEATLFASGQITLLRGPIGVFSVPEMLLADGSCAPARTLAERSYVPLIECASTKATLPVTP